MSCESYGGDYDAMTNEIWVRAWVQEVGGAGGCPAQTGSGSLSAATHQSEPIQQLGQGRRERDTQDKGKGGQGDGNQRGGKSPYDNPGSTTRGTGGTPKGTGGNKNQIPK